MYSTIARHILYPAGEAFLGTRMLKYLRELEESQWWSPSQLQELQNRKLRTLVKYAYDNVPYYHRIFRERGLTERNIQTVEDLPKLPILTKNDIRNSFDHLKAADFKKWKPHRGSTSGFSGEPLQYYTTMDCLAMGWASTFRAWEWAGYKLGDKRATLGGSSLVPDSPAPPFQRMRCLIERNLRLSAFDMDEQSMESYARQLVEYHPRFIRGYPSALYLFACYLERTSSHGIIPTAVFTTAETLLPQHRQAIERQFGCQVFDNYGCNDGGANACECNKHGGYHLASERCIIECVDADMNNITAPGESGDLLLTDLHNYAMPFIRYAVADRGTLSNAHCSCGRGLPLLKSIEGRVSDFITTPEGKKVHGEFFSHIFWELSSFVQFRVVQESQDSLTIKVVSHPSATQPTVLQEIQRIQELVRLRTACMRIDVEQVKEIPTTRAGKYRFIVSNASQ